MYNYWHYLLQQLTTLSATIPIALLSERYAARKKPLIFGLVLLLGSQIMLMEAPNYPVMCAARILQGFGSSMVWVVGLALLYVPNAYHHISPWIGYASEINFSKNRCDCCPASNIARKWMQSWSGMTSGPPEKICFQCILVVQCLVFLWGGPFMRVVKSVQLIMKLAASWLDLLLGELCMVALALEVHLFLQSLRRSSIFWEGLFSLKEKMPSAGA